MQTKQSVTSNVIWRFFEKCSVQIVSFIVSLIIARILGPEVYGVVALVEVFIGILTIFIDSGFSIALVQKKDAGDLEFSTMFYLNIIMSVILYLFLFFSAPLLSSFYEIDNLTLVIRILGITILISAIKSIQTAYVTKHMKFKLFFFSTFGGTFVSAIVGVVMALTGFGVWALVFQYLINNFIDTLILSFTISWKPKRIFSWESFKSLFSFGGKILISRMVDKIYQSSRQLVIGKMFTKSDLAFYNKGEVFPNVLVGNVNQSIESVLFPVMTEIQDDPAQLKNVAKRSLKVSTFVIMPMMTGLAVCAEPLVSLILTEKWLPCIIFIRILCISYAFYSVHSTNINVINALGKSSLVLKLEIIKVIIGMLILFISMWFGVLYIALGFLVVDFICQLINALPNKKLINYGYFEQVKDIVPNIIISLIMGALVYLINFLPLHDFFKLLIQIPLGIGLYICFSVIFKFESYNYIKDILVTKFNSSIKRESNK